MIGCNKRPGAACHAGNGTQLLVTVDSWRDLGGKLWTPNATLPVNLPSLKAPALDWTIGNVDFIFDEHGTRANLAIKPKQAFLPEPSLIFSYLVTLRNPATATGAP